MSADELDDRTKSAPVGLSRGSQFSKLRLKRHSATNM